MSEAENKEAFGDASMLDQMEAEAANDDSVSDQGPPPSEWPYDPVIAENAAFMAGMGFNILSKKYGDHWNIRREDGERLGVAIAQCADHYMNWLTRLGPGGNLLLLTAMLTGPRITKTALIRAQQKAQKKKDAENEQPNQ